MIRHGSQLKTTKMATKELTEGDKLKYIGKGFIGFHPQFLEMEFIEKDGNFDYWVMYKGGSVKGKMLVRNTEVEPA